VSDPERVPEEVIRWKAVQGNLGAEAPKADGLAFIPRLGRYVSAWVNFHRLRGLRIEDYSIEELVDQIFSFAGGFFAPIQIREEIVEACREIQRLQPRYIVEVGTALGGTLYLWSRLAHSQATIVSIDLYAGDFGGMSSLLRVPLFQRLGLPGQKVHLVRGDSHQPATLELVGRYLDGNPADYLFIDRDHSEEGVRADYTMYSQLVRPGGLIAFHDIALPREECGVQSLWKEISGTYRSREILGKPNAYGIGLLYR
jgi:predicted O-methyltransferase YrrM